MEYLNKVELTGIIASQFEDFLFGTEFTLQREFELVDNNGKTHSFPEFLHLRTLNHDVAPVPKGTKVHLFGHLRDEKYEDILMGRKVFLHRTVVIVDEIDVLD